MHRRSLEQRIKSICPFGVIFYYWANLYRMTDNSAVPYMVLIIVVGILGLLQLFVNKHINRRFLTTMLLFYVFSGLLNFIIIGNEDVIDVITDALTYGVAVMMFAFPIRYRQGLISFYVSCSFFVSAYFSGALTHGLLTSSGNYISILLILAVSIYYIGLQNKYTQFRIWDILPPMLCFPLAVWALGRGGIISTAFLLLMALFVFMYQKIHAGSVLYKWMSFLIVLSVVLLFAIGVSLFEEFLTLGKLGREGFETPRPMMWGQYLSKTFESLFYVLLGTPLAQVPSIHEIGDNCHNSFLQLHAFNGIITFLGFVYLLYRSIVYLYKKRLYALLIVTLTIVLRGMTDKFIFGQYGMPIMLYLAFYPFAYARQKKHILIKKE